MHGGSTAATKKGGLPSPMGALVLARSFRINARSFRLPDRAYFAEKCKCVIYFTLRRLFCAILILTKSNREDAVSGNVGLAAYATCGFVIVVYAWRRSSVQACKLWIVLLADLALGGPLLAQAAPASGLTTTGRIAHLQLLTIGMTVWLMQREQIKGG